MVLEPAQFDITHRSELGSPLSSWPMKMPHTLLSRPDTRDDGMGESAVPSAVKSLIGKFDEKIDSKFNEIVSLLSRSWRRRISTICSDSNSDASPPRFSSPPRKRVCEF